MERSIAYLSDVARYNDVNNYGIDLPTQAETQELENAKDNLLELQTMTSELLAKSSDVEDLQKYFDGLRKDLADMGIDVKPFPNLVAYFDEVINTIEENAIDYSNIIEEMEG